MDIAKDLPGRMMALQLKEKVALYNSYMPFFEHGGLFVPTDDVFSLGDEVLLALELTDHPGKKFLRTQVAWINPARTSTQRPKGVGLAFSDDEICEQTKKLIEGELGSSLRSDRVTFTL
ncbi:type 4 pilus biogenesis protein [Neisseria animaloris]|uniref:Type 4 pilus biogenesis protein n=1 Tax=Neisseria animaloris TaxID=326522 RepID=A0A1X3CKA2_9NEIS|nr:PilZ domain-containing protein [Neisseria animaloris]MDO5073174.1 PilZ domain-containing protein [Neisseria animaloris]OSI07811.1 pilus assembly protein [Neisseria animaloris]VEH88450.1 type 4 pilus biogenesis protein [Neisseria animaloris]VEJ21514.1 type 4 pilus biogenesis protein [Neisseria animaloris]